MKRVFIILLLLVGALPSFGSGGVIVRKSDGVIILRSAMDDANGNAVSTGTTIVHVLEVEDNNTIKTLDFSNFQFSSSVVTTFSANASNQSVNGGTVTTGIWTYAITNTTGFTKGKVYIVEMYNALASPQRHRIEFEYGGMDGDPTLDTSGYVNSNAVIVQDKSNYNLSASQVTSLVSSIFTTPFNMSLNLGDAILDIKAKTDNLPGTPASTADVTSVYNRIGAPSGASISSDIATIGASTVAIKAKTDNLTSHPADKSDVRITIVSPK